MPCIDRCCQEAELQDYSRSYQLSGATHLTRPEGLAQPEELLWVCLSHLLFGQLARHRPASSVNWWYACKDE